MKCLSCVLVISFIAAVGCYSSGAPQKACQTVGPGSPHYKYGGPVIGNRAQYYISLTEDGTQTDRFTPGVPLEGSLSTLGSWSMKGFMIRAYSLEGPPVNAQFTPSDFQTSKSMDCTYNNDTLTHANNQSKNVVKFTLTLPTGTRTPSIVLKWALVETKYRFWINETLTLHNSEFGGITGGGERGDVSMVTVLLAVLPALFLV